MKKYKPSIKPQQVKGANAWYYEERGRLKFYINTEGSSGVLSFNLPANRLIKSLKRIGKLECE